MWEGKVKTFSENFHTYEAMIESLSVIGKNTIRFLYKQHEPFHNIQGEGNKPFQFLFSPTKLNSSEIQPGQIYSHFLFTLQEYLLLYLSSLLPSWTTNHPVYTAKKWISPKSAFKEGRASSLHLYLLPDALCLLVCAVGVPVLATDHLAVS